MKLEFMMPLQFEKEWGDFRCFAIKHHANQLYGTMPYSYHLAMVEGYLVEAGFSEYEYRAAAWLHDIIEDTDCTVNVIQHYYGEQVAGLVISCTGVGATRAERNETIFKNLEAWPKAAPIKVADRLANITNCRSNGDEESAKLLKMYLKEWPEFRKRLRPLMQEDTRSLLLWDSLENGIEKAKNGE